MSACNVKYQRECLSERVFDGKSQKYTSPNTGPMLGCRWFCYSQECIIY